MKCPICGTEAKSCGDRDYGDKSAFLCPRCGSYEISGSALSMLESRLAKSPNAGARLSHAIRMQPKKDNEWFMVTSANLDELVAQPLPGVEKQLAHLLKWLGSRMGDDQLGYMELQNEHQHELPGIVGAVDWKRVSRLLEHAKNEGFIDVRNGRQLGMTPKGWQMLNNENKDKDAPKLSKKTKSFDDIHDDKKTVKSNCNECGGERKSFQRRVFSIPGSDGEVSWSTTMEILECCGCESLSMRHEFWFSEWDDYEYDPITEVGNMCPGTVTTVWPPASSRTKPDWVDQIRDEALRTVLDEVYKALDHGLIVLAATGTRTLLDRTMSLRVDDPPGGFVGKLDAMVQVGRIAKEEKEIFLTMIDVGNAAAHRAHVPTEETLDKVVSATESLLHREFILPTDAEAIRQVTPKRPKKESRK
jgi:predicted RNA-binding Zn-ribbon protein involved in translation (DUF1610 family)